MHKILGERELQILSSERELLAKLEAIAVRLDAPLADLEALARVRQHLDEFFLLVVVGEFNSGKSAFINALLGQRFLDEGVTPTTSQVHILRYGPQPAAEQVEPFLLRLSYPVEWLQEINIVDTPGTNAIIQRHQEITEAFVPRSDLILFVTSADRPFSESERVFLQLVKDWGKKVVVVVNKIDILEDEAALNQVFDFVRDHAVTVLGMVPEIFAVSVKLAQRAKFVEDGMSAKALLDASRFQDLEDYILKQLDQAQRLRLKLESPLGVAERLLQSYQVRAREQRDRLQEDFRTIETIDAQLDGYAADMRHDFQFRLTKVENILLDLRTRGDRFFEETIRMGRFLDLINASRIRAEFEQQVVADTHSQIEQEVSALIDWMVERNYRQWHDITKYLQRRSAQRADELVGEIGGQFEINRQQLLGSVGRTARDIVAGYDKTQEAKALSASVQNTLAAMGAVEVGAIGVGAILLHIFTRALDPLGIIAAGSLAIAGLFILPARRRAAKQDLDQKITDLGDRLQTALTQQFERELAQSLQDIREAITPYTRFVRSEHEKLVLAEALLTEINVTLKGLRSQVRSLGNGQPQLD